MLSQLQCMILHRRCSFGFTGQILTHAYKNCVAEVPKKKAGRGIADHPGRWAKERWSGSDPSWGRAGPHERASFTRTRTGTPAWPCPLCQNEGHPIDGNECMNRHARAGSGLLSSSPTSRPPESKKRGLEFAPGGEGAVGRVARPGAPRQSESPRNCHSSCDPYRYGCYLEP